MAPPATTGRKPPPRALHWHQKPRIFRSYYFRAIILLFLSRKAHSYWPGGSGGLSLSLPSGSRKGSGGVANPRVAGAGIGSTEGRLEASVATPGAISSSSNRSPIRVAYQGEPGAYSEKSLRELLGPNVIAVPRPNFEACYRAVASRECDYAMLPIENSLGGSIHENYDLMLRYDLTVVAEHEFRVSHCLLAKPSLKRDEIKFAISHPQALAQCDNYLRANGITPVPTYDTAGSAKMIADALASAGIDGASGAAAATGGSRTKSSKFALPEGCTASNTAAIASDLAAETYRLDCLDSEIEDDDSNFTRFLLLGRNGVVQYLHSGIPTKTSLVFTLPESAGALYKALACFSLRDIDMSKIESRPTSAALLNFLKFRSTVVQAGDANSGRTKQDLPRFRYCFYLDVLASELDERVQNALHHLREQSDYCRVLGSYPQKSRLVGPVHDAIEELKIANAGRQPSADQVTLRTLPSDEEDTAKLNIGIVGYGAFGQFLSRKMAQNHRVSCIDPLDKSKDAESNGVEYFPMFDMMSFVSELDVVILAVPLVEFEDIVASLPVDKLPGKLVIEVCPLSVHPKSVLTRALGPDVDIICSNPMFGPSSSGDPSSWEGLPMVYEKVRVNDVRRCDRFLGFFERARCQMVEMTAEQHDAYLADAEFVTHLTGRLLHGNLLPPTPVQSKEYAALCDVADMTAGDTFDLFYGMFRFNDRAKDHLAKMRENLARVERQLAAKEAYLAASAEMRNSDRQRLIAECLSLLREVAKTNVIESDSSSGGGEDSSTLPNGASKKISAALDSLAGDKNVKQ